MKFLLPIYLIVINIAAFCLMGIDKHRAKRHLWRISEKTLFLPALLGGSFGGIMGMHLFRHKTKHWYFKYGLPGILILQAAAGLWISLYL